MLYTAIDIAKYIVSYCSNKKQPISNLKLQKILYYAFGIFPVNCRYFKR